MIHAQKEIHQRLLITCSGLGMGNAARISAILQALHASKEELEVEVRSWGAGYHFFEEFRRSSGIPFGLAALEPYPAHASAWTWLHAFALNCWKLRGVMKNFRPGAVLLDSDYHWFAYAFRRPYLVFLGQAQDVVARASASSRRLTALERFWLLLREQLDARVQAFIADRVLVPSFSPGPAQGKFQPIPLIVREEFRREAERGGTGELAVLLSGSGLHAKSLCEFARKHGLPVIDTVPSQARQLDGYRALITQGGLSSLSECIALKKFAFVVPMPNHPEQLLNAQEVEKRGMGKCMGLETLASHSVRELLKMAASPLIDAAPGCDGADTIAHSLLANLRHRPA